MCFWDVWHLCFLWKPTKTITKYSQEVENTIRFCFHCENVVIKVYFHVCILYTNGSLIRETTKHTFWDSVVSITITLYICLSFLNSNTNFFFQIWRLNTWYKVVLNSFHNKIFTYIFNCLLLAILNLRHIGNLFDYRRFDLEKVPECKIDYIQSSKRLN